MAAQLVEDDGDLRGVAEVKLRHRLGLEENDPVDPPARTGRRRTGLRGGQGMHNVV